MLVVILGVFLEDIPDVQIITLFQLLFYDTLLKDTFDTELWINRGQDIAKKKSMGDQHTSPPKYSINAWRCDLT